MRTFMVTACALLVVAGCGDRPAGSDAPGADPAGAEGGAPGTPAPAGAAASPGSSPPGAGAAASAARSPGSFDGRAVELLNPDETTMVFLYYDLAGIAPPIDNWVEDDGRVAYAQGPDKASQRAAVRSEFEAGTAAVRGVGRIRLSMNANLSEYDPSYGEFTVRALAPSSVVNYDALRQKIQLKFGNGRTAQLWKVPAEEAQAVRDKIRYVSNVSLDALLRITGVQPGPGGGTITADVVEYELKDGQSGATVGRVQVIP